MYKYISLPFHTRTMLCTSFSVLLASCGGGSSTDSASNEANISPSQLAATAILVPASTNFALNKPATASSVQTASFPTALAFDGNQSSRWSSLFSDAQWIAVDLGAIKTINHVVLNWEAAYGKSYQIQTSTDGANWTTVFSTTAGVGGREDIWFNAVSARYVKMKGVKRGTVYGYSLFEFMVHNDPPANLALSKPATASSVQTATFPATLATDGNLSSRWSSLFSDAQWIMVDLGTTKTINHVVLNWEAAYGKSYQLQTSTDSANWTTVFSTTAGIGGKEDIRFSAVSARYVKMNGVKRGTVYGYSLFEFMVYNDSASTPTPTPTPTTPVGPTITTFTPSGPITVSSGQTVTGLSISNPNGPCIQGTGVSNVHISNNKIGPCGSTLEGSGVSFRNVHDVLVDHNAFDDVATGLFAADSTNNIVFDHNYATRIRGPFPRGQIVQFAGVNGSGHRITCNVSDQTTPGYGRGPEDQVNMYRSSGTAASPILIKYNKLRGGGPSQSGGGILAGDEGSSYITVDTNILVNPGQYGVGIAGGHDNKLLNNKVYSASFPWSNVGVYVWNQYAPAAYGDEVSGNRVNWTNRDGMANNWENGGNSGPITMSNNVFGDSTIGAGIWNDIISQCGN